VAANLRIVGQLGLFAAVRVHDEHLARSDLFARKKVALYRP
jgi:hypothetical protein